MDETNDTKTNSGCSPEQAINASKWDKQAPWEMFATNCKSDPWGVVQLPDMSEQKTQITDLSS